MGTINGASWDAATINGEEVQEITVDGQTVWVSEQMIDDFEGYSTGSIDLMNTYTHGAGDSASYFIVDYVGGSRVLTVNGGSTQNIGAMRGDGSNLDHYIDTGDTFRFNWRMDDFSGGHRAHVWYGMNGYTPFDAGGYVVWVASESWQSGDVRIREWSNWNGSDVTGRVSIDGYTEGQDWACEVSWDGTNHALTVYDENGSFVGSTSGSDSTYGGNDGTVGYGLDNTGVYIDNVELV